MWAVTFGKCVEGSSSWRGLCGLLTLLLFNHQSDQRGTMKPLPGAAQQQYKHDEKVVDFQGNPALIRSGWDKDRGGEPEALLHLLLIFSIKNYLNQTAIHTRLIMLNSPIPQPDAPFTGSPMSSFVLCTPAEVAKLLSSSSSKPSRQDFNPTPLVKSCSSIVLVLISTLANLSMSQGCFHNSFKIAQVSPLLKKIGLDKDNRSNYRPISNLHNISKLTRYSSTDSTLPMVSMTYLSLGSPHTYLITASLSPSKNPIPFFLHPPAFPKVLYSDLSFSPSTFHPLQRSHLPIMLRNNSMLMTRSCYAP